MATAKFDREKLPEGTTDWGALDSLTDEEVERRAAADPDGKPLTDEDLRNLKRSSRVRVLRMALGMTQAEFADAYGIPVGTLRDWEQGRREPDQASKTLLKLIEIMPQDVKAALAGERLSGTGG